MKDVTNAKEQLIMLDIDGVLNTPQSHIYWKHRGVKEVADIEYPCITNYLCPSACSNLQWILDEVPNTRIVVISKWRLFAPIARIQSIFQRNGIDPERIVGQTQELVGWDRGDEIHAYLQAHYGHEEGMPNFVIIDDNSDMGSYKNRLVKPRTYNGLTLLEAFEAATMLGVKELPVYAI